MTETGAIAGTEALLGWWAMAGVDAAVAETPVNWLRPASRSGARDVAATPGAVASTPVMARGNAYPDSLEAFQAWLATEPALPDVAWGNRRILPSGKAGSRLMVICDVPDADDDAAGALLSGAAGMLFDSMMAAIGLSRADLYIASLSTTRPPGGLLSVESAAALATRMRHHVGLVAPHRLLLLGEKTSRALMTANDGADDKGLRAFNHGGGTVDAIATFHPRLLLRQPTAKAECWRQLQHLIEVQPA